MNTMNIGMTKFANNYYPNAQLKTKQQPNQPKKQNTSRYMNGSLATSNPDCIESQYKKDGSVYGATQQSNFFVSA